MLELKHITKVYHTKGGADVVALDDVSLSFPETGLVFLLGKSGSGKSTLLNVAGGLDEPTNGEIVVMGKSSAEFAGSDFDGYRNTYVGFVFQEYNVLEEFNVEDNVALALDLQGRSRGSEEKVSRILREVGLETFAKRRPNTLSGGQKQRIAIARALVKDPQIIMADEPTGALDSATGRQVLETLKKLSSSRLVLVVSHDREAAELYGDRIVELKDGRVLSDVTRHKEQPVRLNENLELTDENTLTVRRGAELDADALARIEKFLRESEGETILCRGEREVAAFRKNNRIDETGARTRFSATTEEDVKINDKSGHAQFIRSRLPAGKAFRIGASGLKIKPFRLVLTILLSAVAFVMFGLFSTLMLYDETSVMIRSFTASDIDYISVQKTYRIDRYVNGEYIYSFNSPAKLTPAETMSLGGKNAIGTYSLNNKIFPFNLKENAETPVTEYDNPMFTGAAYVSSDSPLRVLIAGNYPAADDEICVSAYFAEVIQKYDIFLFDEAGNTTNESVTVRSSQELIGRELLVDGEKLTVAGVFAGETVPSAFDVLKVSGADENSYLYYQFQSYLSESINSLMLVSENFVQAHADLFENSGTRRASYFQTAYESYCFFCDPESSGPSGYLFAVYESAPERMSVTFFSGDGTLTDSEIAVPADWINSLLPSWLGSQKFDSTTYFNYLGHRSTLLLGCVYDENGDERPATEEEYAAAVEAACAFFSTLDLSVNACVYDSTSDSGSFRIVDNCKIVGFFTPYDNEDRYEEGVYCSQEFFDKLSIDTVTEKTNYIAEADACYSKIFIPFDHTETGISAVLNQTGTNEETSVGYSVSNSLYADVIGVSQTVESLSQIFLVVGVILAVFAALLLFNFISVSISNKRREIGILRAVGARGTDVFKIFFAEAGIIVGICLLLALVGTAVASIIVNNVLRAELGFMVQLFQFGPLPVLTMIAIAVVVALISTFLPVFFAARKKPVESIRAL